MAAERPRGAAQSRDLAAKAGAPPRETRLEDRRPCPAAGGARGPARGSGARLPTRTALRLSGSWRLVFDSCLVWVSASPLRFGESVSRCVLHAAGDSGVPRPGGAHPCLLCSRSFPEAAGASLRARQPCGHAVRMSTLHSNVLWAPTSHLRSGGHRSATPPGGRDSGGGAEPSTAQSADHCRRTLVT